MILRKEIIQKSIYKDSEYFHVSIAPEYDVLKSDEQQKTTQVFEKIIVEKDPIELEKVDIYTIINDNEDTEFLINETFRKSRAVKATEKDLLYVLENEFDMDRSDFEIKYVNIGYANEENQKDGYFSNEYSLSAYLYEIGDFISQQKKLKLMNMNFKVLQAEIQQQKK